MTPRLSPPARRLLETSLDSLEKLEVMRYLENAQGAVSRTDLMRAVQLDRETANALIGELVHAELADTSGDRGRVVLGEAAQGEAYEEVLQAYEEDRLLVVSTLSAISLDRIRSMAMRTFGEALVSKKKPSDNNNTH